MKILGVLLVVGYLVADYLIHNKMLNQKDKQKN